MYSHEDGMTGKRNGVLMELHVLAHTVKRYMDGLAEAQGQNGSLTGKGISGTNLMILGHLYENRGRDVFQKELEEKLNVRRSTISKVLQIMEHKGLIRREQVARDGRLRKIVLTQESLSAIENWRHTANQVETRLTRNFTEEELDQFHYLLEKAKDNFR